MCRRPSGHSRHQHDAALRRTEQRPAAGSHDANDLQNRVSYPDHLAPSQPFLNSWYTRARPRELSLSNPAGLSRTPASRCRRDAQLVANRHRQRHQRHALLPTSRRCPLSTQSMRPSPSPRLRCEHRHRQLEAGQLLNAILDRHPTTPHRLLKRPHRRRTRPVCDPRYGARPRGRLYRHRERGERSAGFRRPRR